MNLEVLIVVSEIGNTLALACEKQHSSFGMFISIRVAQYFVFSIVHNI